MSIAQRVVDEILRQQMFQVYSDNPDARFTVAFKPNATEQLEAVIADQLAVLGRLYFDQQQRKEKEGG